MKQTNTNERVSPQERKKMHLKKININDYKQKLLAKREKKGREGHFLNTIQITNLQKP